jgi:hypothetical protein
MRRALLPWLPALSYHYGLKPWDIDRMTFREIEVFKADCARLNTAPPRPTTQRRR